MALGHWWTRLWVGVPEVGVAPAGLEAEVVAFAGVLRASGMGVPVTAVLACVEALAVLGADRREHVYWAGRLTLVRRPEDLSIYDAAFRSFWVEGRRVSAAGDDSTEAPVNEESVEVAYRDVRWSRREVLRDKDFATCSPSELEEAHRLMRDIRLAAAMRRSRRWRRSTRGRIGARPDLRRTLRASMRTGGDPVRRVFLDPSIANVVAGGIRHEPGTPADPLDSLSDREREVLVLLAQGHTYQQIAETLYISPKTVDFHRANVLRKLNLASRADLTKYAVQRGLIA